VYAEVIVFPRKKQYKNLGVSDFMSLRPCCLNRTAEVCCYLLNIWYMVLRVSDVVSSRRKTNEARLSLVLLCKVSTFSIAVIEEGFAYYVPGVNLIHWDCFGLYCSRRSSIHGCHRKVSNLSRLDNRDCSRPCHMKNGE
jgi:hypothetical protein